MRAAVPVDEHHPPAREVLEGLNLSRVDLVAHVTGDHPQQHATDPPCPLSGPIGAVRRSLPLQASEGLPVVSGAQPKRGTIAITLAMFALAGLTFDLTQFLQFVKGYSPHEAGLRILPLVAGFGLAGHLGQHLVRRVGTRWAVAGGLGAIAALLLAFAQVEPTTAYWLLGSGLFLIGIAMGTVFIPSTDAVMAAVPEVNAGLGSALDDTSRQEGAALGIGVLGSLTNATYSAQIQNSLTGLAPDMAALAKQSVGAALQVADGIGGEAGLTLHRAATEALATDWAWPCSPEPVSCLRAP